MERSKRTWLEDMYAAHGMDLHKPENAEAGSGEDEPETPARPAVARGFCLFAKDQEKEKNKQTGGRASGLGRGRGRGVFGRGNNRGASSSGPLTTTPGSSSSGPNVGQESQALVAAPMLDQDGAGGESKPETRGRKKKNFSAFAEDVSRAEEEFTNAKRGDPLFSDESAHNAKIAAWKKLSRAIKKKGKRPQSEDARAPYTVLQKKLDCVVALSSGFRLYLTAGVGAVNLVELYDMQCNFAARKPETVKVAQAVGLMDTLERTAEQQFADRCPRDLSLAVRDLRVSTTFSSGDGNPMRFLTYKSLIGLFPDDSKEDMNKFQVTKTAQGFVFVLSAFEVPFRTSVTNILSIVGNYEMLKGEVLPSLLDEFGHMRVLIFYRSYAVEYVNMVLQKVQAPGPDEKYAIITRWVRLSWRRSVAACSKSRPCALRSRREPNRPKRCVASLLLHNGGKVGLATMRRRPGNRWKMPSPT